MTPALSLVDVTLYTLGSNVKGFVILSTSLYIPSLILMSAPGVASSIAYWILRYGPVCLSTI